ncbi:MAG: L-threonylcarbamoyladenylate synthase [Kiritimatiellae bacterium]|jgi:L-threonylcarbamoyladenylate synthase|nr:L-threonylcarbamoyladenylate synthase [Kiritimatiellia bacterium]
MQCWSNSSEGLEHAVEALRAGKLVGMPTETVYGLAGNALDEKVVASIFAAKQRPTFDPLIVHTAHPEQAFDLASAIPREAEVLAERFWPGPLTLVLPRRKGMPDLLSAGLETLALRVPSHPLAHQLLLRSGLALAAPSANRFGHISPTTAQHVMEELGHVPEVAGVLDAGPCEMGVESTVLGFPGQGRVVVYRLGATPLEELREVVEEVEWVREPNREFQSDRVQKGEQSPGMLDRHYAPRTPMLLLERGEPAPAEAGPTGWLFFDSPLNVEGPREFLSKKGDLREAATRLFACMRRLDEKPIERIVAWKVPDQGLGRAINDRLTRAAAE